MERGNETVWSGEVKISMSDIALTLSLYALFMLLWAAIGVGVLEFAVIGIFNVFAFCVAL